ncbi:kinase-like domain-containing protein [Phialemonium atrogriseum]|uniref:EKC/KEOPS complex subunit BUD32 n=1 Tax=Phialemonium atrogriseum TaxID=1093897 RepID=A0AAJ0FRU7_9PEZI|nr:kinase-like domain-containing protein [Phialemonium atrogriseum]KAK1770520.1 kinase-like domain-containing protein [Phialemonium atrogriseum]
MDCLNYNLACSPKIDLPQAADSLWRRLYIRGVDDDLERFHSFRPGGYCPIHLHDEINDGQYRIIHKLGHGGYATVWLCRDQHADTPSYVAVKILIASEAEKDSCSELLLAANLTREREREREGIDKVNKLVSQSPNGTHVCLVYPVLGPVARDAANIFDGQVDYIEILQEISRQAVAGLAALHSRGICHGDFRPWNILLELQGLDGLDEEQVLSLLGEPETTDVHIRTDSRPTPEMPYAPKYLVYPPDFGDVYLSVISRRTQVIDFGQSFDTSQRPPPAAFGIPANYAAPEVVLDSSGSTPMDLWSLGCTLYEIRLGRRLFDVFQLVGLRKEDYPWATYYSESDNESDTGATPSNPLSGNGDTCIEPQVERPRPIQEKLASCHDCTGQGCAHPRFQLISEAEATILADLLERLLRYQPEERLSAQDVLKQAWFHTQF